MTVTQEMYNRTGDKCRDITSTLWNGNDVLCLKCLAICLTDNGLHKQYINWLYKQ